MHVTLLTLLFAAAGPVLGMPTVHPAAPSHAVGRLVWRPERSRGRWHCWVGMNLYWLASGLRPIFSSEFPLLRDEQLNGWVAGTSAGAAATMISAMLFQLAKPASTDSPLL